MKLSKKWLAEFCDIDATPKGYADAMTLSGSKVEAFELPGEEIDRVVVGRVTEMERHPDSDHMWTCMVDVGEGADIQIVTGAQNVNVGDLVPVPLDRQLIEVLDKPERRLVLQIIDDKDQIAENRSIDSFIAGFRLAWQLGNELAAHGTVYVLPGKNEIRE